MKNLITPLLLLGMLSLFSCTQVIYSHEQVMDRYKTKQNIAKVFGLPTEKITRDTSEKWLYKYSGSHSRDEYRNVSTLDVPEFGKYKRYVVFNFDKQGNVASWEYQGVNFAERGEDSAATVLAALFGGFLLFASILGVLYSR